MNIVGSVIKIKRIDKGITAMLLLTDEWVVPALTHDEVQEGDEVELNGSYRIRDGMVEFFAEGVKKVLIT